jgi:hypothetical protein
MVIDSIQVNPFQLPLQAWPMAPAYGASGPLALSEPLATWLSGLAGAAGQPIGGAGGFLPLPTGPLTAPLYGSSLVPLQAVPTLVPSQAMLQAEQQALYGFLQEVAAGPIRKLHEYLDAHSQQYSQLAQCIPLVQQAAKAFGVHDYTQALTQIYQAYRYITALRASIPELPSL